MGIDSSRADLLRRAVLLEYLTVGWNLIEGAIAVTAAQAAGSAALLGFGLDSFVECSSGVVLLWRLFSERRGMHPEALEALDQKAHRLVGMTLFALGAFICVDAGMALWSGERPGASPVGLALVSLSLAVMWWLARAKSNAARQLESRALKADAFQTVACMWLSFATLAGLGLNAAFGWWWADPIAALAVAALVVREGTEAWRGESCC